MKKILFLIIIFLSTNNSYSDHKGWPHGKKYAYKCVKEGGCDIDITKLDKQPKLFIGKSKFDGSNKAINIAKKGKLIKPTKMIGIWGDFKNDSSKQNKDESEEQKSKNEEKDKKQESNQNEISPSDNEPQQKEQSETARTSLQELSQEEAEQLLGNLSEDLKKFSQMQAGKIKPAQPYKNNLW